MESINARIPVTKDVQVSLDTKNKTLKVQGKKYKLDEQVLTVIESLMVENTMLKEYMHINEYVDIDNIQ